MRSWIMARRVLAAVRRELAVDEPVFDGELPARVRGLVATARSYASENRELRSQVQHLTAERNGLDQMLKVALAAPVTVQPGAPGTCRRHDGEVSALIVNSVSEPPLLGDLAYMAAEHEAEHHGGPAMPDEEASDPSRCRCAAFVGDDPETDDCACGHAYDRHAAGGQSCHVIVATRPSSGDGS